MSRPDEQTERELRKSIRGVLEKELVPRIEESEQKGEYCLEAHRALGQLGLLAPMLPEEFGGMNDTWAQLYVAEEMGYYSSSFGLSALASAILFGNNIANQGSEEQKQKYLPSIIDGSKIGCWGLTEPGIGSDAVGVKTTSVDKGDHYLLNGSKTFITNAPIADYMIVLTRQIDEFGKPVAEGIEGGTAFVLERGMDGLSTGQPFKKMGHRASPTGEIFMENVEVPKENVLGEPGKAFFDMKHSLDVERVIFSGLGIGMSRFCLETATKYTQSRKQFGKPIAAFQMVQDHIANMTTQYDVAEKYLHYVTEQMVAGNDVNKTGAIAKYFIGKAVNTITDLAIQCHGGYGYMEEYQVERYDRDAKLFEIGAGTNEIQKLIIAKQTLKEFSLT